MKNRSQFLLSLTLFLLFNLSVSGQNAPVKTYQSTTHTVHSYDYEGIKGIFEKDDDTTYVINFWATWCAPCVAELPYFELINKEYSSKNVKVILVSLDFKKQMDKGFMAFLERKNIQSEVIHLSDPDANSWIEKVDKAWSGAIPATLIYNSKKKKRQFYEKAFTLEELTTEIQTFIQ